MFQQQHFSFLGHFAENRDEHYIALNGLTQEENIVDEVPVESVASHEEKNHDKCRNKNNEDGK